MTFKCVFLLLVYGLLSSCAQTGYNRSYIISDVHPEEEVNASTTPHECR